MTPGNPDDKNSAYDPSIVPGLVDPVPAPRTTPGAGSRPLDMSQDPDRYDPTRPAVPAGPLDMSKDPDRYDPAADPSASISVVGPLDPRRDPDRMDAGRGQSLTDLVGKSRAHEDERDNYTWALGLLGVLAFLGLVAFLFGQVLNNY